MLDIVREEFERIYAGMGLTRDEVDTGYAVERTAFVFHIFRNAFRAGLARRDPAPVNTDRAAAYVAQYTLDDFADEKGGAIEGILFPPQSPPKHARIPLYTAANSGANVPNGDWLWSELMDFCKARKYAPTEFNDLFAIVGRAREAAPQPLSQERIEQIVNQNTTDDAGYDIWCHGAGVARDVEAAHKIAGHSSAATAALPAKVPQ